MTGAKFPLRPAPGTYYGAEKSLLLLTEKRPATTSRKTWRFTWQPVRSATSTLFLFFFPLLFLSPAPLAHILHYD